MAAKKDPMDLIEVMPMDQPTAKAIVDAIDGNDDFDHSESRTQTGYFLVTRRVVEAAKLPDHATQMEHVVPEAESAPDPIVAPATADGSAPDADASSTASTKE